MKPSDPRAFEPSQLHIACLISFKVTSCSIHANNSGVIDLKPVLPITARGDFLSSKILEKNITVDSFIASGVVFSLPLYRIVAIEFLDLLIFVAKWKYFVFLSPSLHQFSLDLCLHIASIFLLTSHCSVVNLYNFVLLLSDKALFSSKASRFWI